MELSEEAKKEFRDAIRILREDGFHVHRTAEAYAKSKETSPPAPEPVVKPPKEGDPPPVKDKQDNPPKPPSDWWFGNRDHNA